MRHMRKALPVIGLLIVLVTGCKKEIRSGSDTSTMERSTADKATISVTTFREKMLQLRTKLPAGLVAKVKANFSQRVNTPYRERVLRVLKVIEPTPCGPTALDEYLEQELADWTAEDFDFAFGFLLLDLPFYYAWFFENNARTQAFGVNGEYTQVITKTFKDLKRFWNIETSNMIVSATHGRMLTDAGKISSTLKILFDFDQATADFYGELVSGVVKENPPYRAGNHPLFTFNAVALPTTDIPTIGIVPNKILMGDGIMEAYTAMGYGDVAPQAILAHEFGHQIQFQKDLFEDVSSPEETRRTELMADAFSAYYLSHARGASMQWKRVQQFLQVFFTIGDCAFDDVGHHGTPLQRMAAAEWGYNLANEAQKQGHILTAEVFAALFDAHLSEIVAP
jgi:hypothetical protein